MKKGKIAAGICVSLPYINGLFLLLCFIVGIITNKNDAFEFVYAFSMIIAILGFIISPFISMVMGILGLVFAGIAKKNGHNHLAWIYVLGIIDIIIALIGFVIDFIIIFITGPSV